MSLQDWNGGLPCEEDGIVFCGRCKPKPFPIEVIVTNGGNAFHLSASCQGIIDGQRGIERSGGRVSPARVVHREVAISDGYFPCLLCFPEARGHT